MFEDLKKKLDQKTVLSFLVPFVLFFVLSPGVFIECNTEDKIKKSCVIKKSTAFIHALIFGVLMFCFWKFFLDKNCCFLKASI